MRRHLFLRLDAPLMAFGGETIDNYGVIRVFPAKSMIAGLIANALGLERWETQQLQALQDALTLGSRVDRQGSILKDFQTAEISKGDQGWTTNGRVEGRGGGAGSYAGPHLRYRDYWTECEARIVIRLADNCLATIDQIKEALRIPARPLFIGRKPCVPSLPVLEGEVQAVTIFGALMSLSSRTPEGRTAYLQWPARDGPQPGDGQFSEEMRLEPICDERNWVTGVHGGHRMVRVMALAQKSGQAEAA